MNKRDVRGWGEYLIQVTVLAGCIYGSYVMVIGLVVINFGEM